MAVTRSDHARLLRLADTLSRRNAELGLQLFQELERAEILPDDTQRDIVRMGSTLDYETDDGGARTVTLVFPHEEDISAGKVSILTPVGVALLGLARGSEIDWHTRDGRPQRLKVVRIAPQPAATPLPSAATASSPAQAI